MTSRVFPSNNLYHHVVERNDIPVVEVCSRELTDESGNPIPQPLVRTLSFPLTSNVDELINIIRLLYFVVCVKRHESGNLIVWTLMSEPNDQSREVEHIGLLRSEGTNATPALQSTADEIMRGGIYQSCINILQIERVIRSWMSSEMNIPEQYGAYIIYLRQSDMRDTTTEETEEGEVEGGAW